VHPSLLRNIDGTVETVKVEDRHARDMGADFAVGSLILSTYRMRISMCSFHCISVNAVNWNAKQKIKIIYESPVTTLASTASENCH